MSASTYRLLNLLLLGALFAGSVMVYPLLPERFPQHFDIAGKPDAWQERSLVGWLLIPAFAAGMAGLLHLATRFTADNPQLWSVPDKRRFLALTPEERAPVIHRLQRFMGRTGITCTVIMMVVQVSVYQAAVAPVPRMPAYTLAAVALLTGGLVVAGLRMNRTIAALIRDAYGRRDAAS